MHNEGRAVTDDTSTSPIPHHQLSPGDVLRWQCDKFPEVIHRWRVIACCHGGMGQESVIQVVNVSHSPAYTPDGKADVMAIPAVLVRQCTIEDVGDRFGIPSARRFAK